LTRKLERLEEERCIECDGVKHLEICKTCRDIVCKGCMFNHNQNELEAMA